MFTDTKPNGWLSTPRKPADPPTTRIDLNSDEE